MIRIVVLGVVAAGALAAWRLTRPVPLEPPRWDEAEDGIQPPDAYPSGLIAVRDPADPGRFAVRAEYRPDTGWTATEWALDV